MANTVVGIRFKSAGKKYYFDPQGISFEMCDKVVVETIRGYELGEVIENTKDVEDSELIEETTESKKTARILKIGKETLSILCTKNQCILCLRSEQKS